jgi:gliding motility-associated-like protein
MYQKITRFKGILFLLLTALTNLTLSTKVTAQCDTVKRSFTISVQKGCLPQAATFTVTPKYDPKDSLAFYWDLNDSGIYRLAGSKTINLYNKPKNYTPKLKIVSSKKGSSGSSVCQLISKSLNLKSLTNPSFQIKTSSLCRPPYKVTLEDITNVTGLPVSYRKWTITGTGYSRTDSLPASEKLDTLTLPAPGNYSVVLQLGDSNGCDKVTIVNNYIAVSNKLAIDFCSDLKEGFINRDSMYTTFTGSSISGTVNKWIWDFGDGTKDSTSGNLVKHIYTGLDSSKTTSITLIGKAGTCSDTVTATGLITKYYRLDSKTNRDVCRHTSVFWNLTNQGIKSASSITPSTSIKATSAIKGGKVNYIYTGYGLADVGFTFKVKGPSCASNTLTIPNYYNVLLPDASFTSKKTKGCGPVDTIDVTVKTRIPNSTYTWYLYDSAKTNPTVLQTLKDTVGINQFVIKTTGLYSVQCRISTKYPSGKICTDTSFAYGWIWIASPNANFNVDTSTTTICSGGKVKINNLTTPKDTSANPFKYVWTAQHTTKTFVKSLFTGKVPTMILDTPGVYHITLEVTNSLLCKGTYTDSYAVTVNGVTADVAFASSSLCPPVKNAKFTTNISSIFPAKSSSSLVYNWTLTPGAPNSKLYSSTSSGTATADFNTTGSYDFKLEILQKQGKLTCTTTVSKPQFIKIGTAAKFNVDSINCLNTNVQFQDVSDGNPDDWAWSITSSPAGSNPKFVGLGASGATSTAQNPVAIFDKEGTYTIKQTVSKQTTASCNSTYSKQIVVVHLKPDFTSNDRLKFCAPKLVNFRATIKGVTKYSWNFGDDTVWYDFGDTIAYHYYLKNNPTGFTVKLAVQNSNGCSDTIVKSKYIVILGPVPQFQLSTRNACGSSSITLTNKSNFIAQASLDLKDGSPIDSSNFKSLNHIYLYTDLNQSKITYYPELITSDSSHSCYAIYKDSITLNRPPFAAFDPSNPKPNSTGVSSGCNPLNVKFLDESRYATNRKWDFNNDGTYDDTGSTPTYIYTNSGSYTVRQAVSNGLCFDTLTKVDIIQVYPTPKAGIGFSTYVTCPNTAVTFYDSNTVGIITNYIWDFGDSSATSTDQNPTHSYVHEGFKPVKLIVQTANPDGSKCTDSTIKTIQVNAGAIPPAPQILYVTVDTTSSTANPNGTVQVKWTPFSGSPLGFSVYELFRASNVTPIYTTGLLSDVNYHDQDAILDPANNIYGYTLTTSNPCGKISNPADTHRTVLLTASGTYNANGAANQLNWSPYVGWTSVQNYLIYRRDSFANGFGYKMIAKVPGTSNSYLDEHLCFHKFLYMVVAVNSADSTVMSMSNKVAVIPQYQWPNLPTMRYVTVKNNTVLKIKWSIPATTSKLGSYTLERKGPKDLKYNVVAQIPFDTTFYVDMAKLIKVDADNYVYRVKVKDSCGYSSSYSNIGTNIVLTGEVTKTEQFAFTWTPYQYFVKGVQNYYIQIKDNNGAWNTLKQIDSATLVTTIDSSFTDLDSAACFRILGVSSPSDDVPAIIDSSVSNEVCLVTPSKIWVPTAFTPGVTKGINDIFKPVNVSIYGKAKNNELLQYEFQVFDRWGTRVFSTNDVKEGWDGTFNGNDCPSDVYIWYVKGYGLDRRTNFQKGTVHLLK